MKGGTLFKPTFFEYPQDETLYLSDIDNFMLGDALIVHPVLKEGVTQIDAYFPKDRWYDF